MDSGMTRRRNQNLAPDEAAILRGIAAYHGYTQKSGQQTGDGSAFALTLAIVHGDVQTTSFDEDELRRVVPWLEAHGDELGGVIGELAAQLGAQLPEQSGVARAGATDGPIETMDG